MDFNKGAESHLQDVNKHSAEKQPYIKPQILSVEPLEAVAAPCSPPGGRPPPFFGKAQPPGCVHAQS